MSPPKGPSIAGFSGLQPYLDIERVIPRFSHLSIMALRESMLGYLSDAFRVLVRTLPPDALDSASRLT